MSNEFYQGSNMEEQFPREGRALTTSDSQTPSKSQKQRFLKAFLAIGAIGVVSTLAYFATSEPKASFKSNMLMPLVPKGDPKSYRVNENESGFYGVDGGNWFESKCPQGYYVKRFDMRGWTNIDAIKFGCVNDNNDWNWLDLVGNSNGGNYFENLCDNKYRKIRVYYSTWFGVTGMATFCNNVQQKIIGTSSTLNDADTFECPTGQFIYGASGNVKGNLIRRIRFHCANEASPPSPKPTAGPSRTPTEKPSSAPTVNPTYYPIADPTASPTREPARICPIANSIERLTISGCVIFDQHAKDVILVPGQKWSYFKVCASKHTGLVQLASSDLQQITFSDSKGPHSFVNTTYSLISTLFIGVGVSVNLYGGRNFDGSLISFEGPKILNLRDYTFADTGNRVNNAVYSLSVSSSTEKTGNC